MQLNYPKKNLNVWSLHITGCFVMVERRGVSEPMHLRMILKTCLTIGQGWKALHFNVEMQFRSGE